MTDGTGLPGDPHRAPCERCPDGHTDPRTKPWGTHIPGGGYEGVTVERSDGGHVAQADADWLWWLTKMAPFVSAEHYPEDVREHPEGRYWVTCACGHKAVVRPGVWAVIRWYHAHALWPDLTPAQLYTALFAATPDGEAVPVISRVVDS